MRADVSRDAMPHWRVGRGPLLPQPLPPLPPFQLPPPCHCCRAPARLCTHCRAAAAAGVSGAARARTSGRRLATSSSAAASSCLMASALFLFSAAAGFTTSSCSCASCSSRLPPPRSSASSPSSPSSPASFSSSSSSAGATMVRPVQLMIWSSCFAVKYLADPSRASAKASDSTCTASAKRERNFLMLRTRKTRQLSSVAFDLSYSGIWRRALVTAPMSASSSIRPPSLGFTTAAFVTGFLATPSESESSSKKQGVSHTVSMWSEASVGAWMTISSWYSVCKNFVKVVRMVLAWEASMVACSRGASIGKPAHSDCCRTTKTS
mmetsp:Transcript_10752/g.34027  ORF Transcript_10752/g.34027 Transcript_10752/m.34027 type:complete len:322 (-) Transcript_10752:264-1229(-)